MPKKKPAARPGEYIPYRHYGKERAPVAAHNDALAELLDRIESEQRNTERWNKSGAQLAVDQPHLWSHAEWKRWIAKSAKAVNQCCDATAASALRSQSPRWPLAGSRGLHDLPIFSLTGLKSVAQGILQKAADVEAAPAAGSEAPAEIDLPSDEFRSEAKPKSRELFRYLAGCKNMRSTRIAMVNALWSNRPVTPDAPRKGVENLGKDLLRFAAGCGWRVEHNREEVWLEQKKMK